MRKASAAIFAYLMFSAIAHGQAPGSYIGFEYKGASPNTILRNGVKHLGGSLVSDHRIDPVYAVSQVSKGSTSMLWLEVSTGQNEKGATGWRVLDVLQYPKPTGRMDLLMPHGPGLRCTRDGENFTNLIAIGALQRPQLTYTLQHAWLADIKKKKFVSVPVRGIKCIYSEPVPLI